MTEEPHGVHLRPHRAVSALRTALLVVLCGLVLALIASYGGRRAKPQAEITVAPAAPATPGQGPVLDQAEQFKIDGSREGRPAFTLQARTVTGYAGDRKILHDVHLVLHEEEGAELQVSGDEGQFDAADRRARLSGHVVIRGQQGLSLTTGTLYYDTDRDVIFTGDEVTFSLGGLEGQGRGLNYLVGDRQIKIPDQVRLEVRDAGAPTVLTITSGDLMAALRENTAVFTDDVRLVRGVQTLRGNYVKLTFDETRQHLTGLSAFGEVVATLGAPNGGERSELRSDSLTARFRGADGSIDEADASGGCRVLSGPYTTRSTSARFRRADDRVELRGEPVLLTARDRIAAQEIDLHPNLRQLEARGDVRTVSLPSGGGPAMPGFGSGSAISFQAQRLHVDERDHRAVYSGSARAWQEGNSIQADELVLEEAIKQLRASGSVMARWSDARPPAGRAAARPAVSTITSRTMILDDGRSLASYRGDVRLTRPDATLTSDAMDATLSAPGDRGRELQRVEATGSVAVKRAGSYGTARSAEYLSDENLLILRDEAGLAEVVDIPTGRTMRGRTLTFDLAGDRILTESAGGRTWITLTPEGKDVPSVEPKTRY